MFYSSQARRSFLILKFPKWSVLVHLVLAIVQKHIALSYTANAFTITGFAVRAAIAMVVTMTGSMKQIEMKLKTL